jgi:nucleoside-diphosphate-sugar epimerase
MVFLDSPIAMKIFVTGASGFIGEEVALGLRRAGHEVWGLVRDPKKAANLAQNEIHVVIGDLSDRNSYRQWCEHCNVIIHCAADWNNYQV